MKKCQNKTSQASLKPAKTKVSFTLCFCYQKCEWVASVGDTVLQIQVYPKNNAPGVSKPPRVAKSDFLLILKIFLTLDDIRPSN